MYTVSQLVELLNLQTENQVRNRLNVLRDQLVGHLRRGPNNQLLLTETGLEILRALQALCETGHTLHEASALLRYDVDQQESRLGSTWHSSVPNRTIPDVAEDSPAGGWAALVQHLAEQVRALDARVAALEAKAQTKVGHTPWWENWR